VEEMTGAVGNSSITVASANEAGQIVVALRGGTLIYLSVVAVQDDGGGGSGVKIVRTGQTKLDREISCMDLNPFETRGDGGGGGGGAAAMEIDGAVSGSTTDSQCSSVLKSQVVAVGLWDDFTVRLLSLDLAGPLTELLRINLGTEDRDATAMEATKSSHTMGQNMMARSLCLVTLDSKSSAGTTSSRLRRADGTTIASSSSAAVTNQANMLLVGLGDGGLVSFAISRRSSSTGWQVHSRKEVSLGTRGINLVPFRNHGSPESSGTCVLATGDRPTVIYLAGGGGGGGTASGSGNSLNPKLCFSNVNLERGDSDEGDEVLGHLGNGRERLLVNVATPFYSSVLFDVPNNSNSLSSSSSSSSGKHYSLCVSDEATLRLGMIDDIQKLHVSTHRLGMTPRRVAYHESGRVVCVGCIDDGYCKINGASNSSYSDEINMGNCVRFFDDTSFEEITRLNMDPYEMILSIVSTELKVTSEYCGAEKESVANLKSGNDTDRQVECYRSYLVVGTAYVFPDEDESSKGRIIIIQCTGSSDLRLAGGNADISSNTAGGGGNSLCRKAVQVAELQLRGAAYSVCPFYDGTILATVNSKTRLYKLVDGGSGISDDLSLKVVGHGHHGHILSLCVKSRMPSSQIKGKEQEQLAIVGDLMRSIAVLKYYPKYQALEEVARDFNPRWTTAIEMLSDNIYLGGENFGNLFVLRRNASSKSEELRCRLDTVGLFNIGEMVNKFMGGTLVMPSNSYNSSTGLDAHSPGASGYEGKASGRRAIEPVVKIGSKTLFGGVDGTLGSILGLDARTATFFAALERSMAQIIRPIGNLKHDDFRAYRTDTRLQPNRGFVDGDLVESFLDLDNLTMEAVVSQMNREGRWETDDYMESGGTLDGSTSGLEGGIVEDMKTRGNGQMLTVNDVLSMVEEIAMMH